LLIVSSAELANYRKGRRKATLGVPTVIAYDREAAKLVLWPPSREEIEVVISYYPPLRHL
jgi:hypothetical protein